MPYGKEPARLLQTLPRPWHVPSSSHLHPQRVRLKSHQGKQPCSRCCDPRLCAFSPYVNETQLVNRRRRQDEGIAIWPPEARVILFDAHDPDFAEMFKVLADFDTSIVRHQQSVRYYAGFLAHLARQEG